jgi:hypothetical protein
MVDIPMMDNEVFTQLVLDNITFRQTEQARLFLNPGYVKIFSLVSIEQNESDDPTTGSQIENLHVLSNGNQVSQEYRIHGKAIAVNVLPTEKIPAKQRVAPRFSGYLEFPRNMFLPCHSHTSGSTIEVFWGSNAQDQMISLVE